MMKRSKIKLSVAAVCVWLACLALAAGAQSPARSRITVASGVRLRQMPNTAAEEVARLGIGTIVDELERSPARERVGGAEDFWYRVSVPGGKAGWVFGSFTAPLEAGSRVATYRRIAAERLKAEPASFTDMADLARFLSSIAAETMQPDEAAELALAWLLAVKRAAEAIPIDKQAQPPYQGWLKANDALLVYSEPAGQWFVRAELFWELAKKHRTLAIGERIAWEASRLFLPGECEGDPTCQFYALTQTSGRYLSLYPRGQHAEEAMKETIEALTENLELIKTAEPVAADLKADALKQVATLRAAIQSTASPGKARALELLLPYEKYVRR